MSADRLRATLRRRATSLLDQQLWCWGRDIVRPAGNVLLDLGMCRFRPPQSAREGNLYTCRVAGDAEVWLWGFGLLYCTREHGGIFLRRYGFDPLLLEHPPKNPVFRPGDLGPLARPTTASRRRTAAILVRAAVEWIAGYEHWVAEQFGIGYREAVLAARKKSPAVAAQDMAREWERIAKKAGRLSAALPATGPWSRILDGLRPPPDLRLPTQPWLNPHSTPKFGLRHS